MMSNDNIDDWMKLIKGVRAKLDSGELTPEELERRLNPRIKVEPEPGSVNGLMAEFDDWKKSNSFHGDASPEHLLYSEPNILTPEQRAWLLDLNIRWAREVDETIKRHQGT
jgi:hypothetical protein